MNKVNRREARSEEKRNENDVLMVDGRQNNERRKLRDEARRDVVSRSKCVAWHVTVQRLKAAKHDGTKVGIKIT